MDKKDLNRLSHMLDAAKAINQHIAHKNLSDLEQNRLLLGGIIRELLLIGEAANAVSSQAKAILPDIPWREIIGMRNQLIHGYFDISYRIIWSTIKNDIPSLIIQLEKALSSFY
ncbi:MAG: DUF86 domain-containing protein [Verrucomicrobia bacterium]|nr:DUF86 domain-containing protein [Verrucomicrobiota bacterium]